MSGILGTMSLLFAVLVILSTFMLTLSTFVTSSTEEHTMVKPITRTEHEDFRDCQDIQKQKGKGWSESGVYTIKPKGWKSIKVYCDMKTDGGGWTVFQRRFDGSEDFYRKWADYKSGFGKLNKEFWLGNENIHRISAQGKYKLRINLEDFYGNRRYAKFNHFQVSNEKDRYRIHFRSYSGNAGYIRFQALWNSVFSTKDVARNDCAKTNRSGFWYGWPCRLVQNLNGVYGSKQNASFYNNVWYGKWSGDKTERRAMKSTTMMMRRMITDE